MSFRLTLACLMMFAARLSAADVPARSTPPPADAATAVNEEEGNQPEAKKDPAEAKFWQAVTLLGSKSTADQVTGRATLQATADLEYVHAQTLLADCYLSGSYGFAKDPRKAANLLRLAAERGNAFAMVSLGSCYVTGTGVRKDQEKAVTWLTAALAPNANFSRPTPPADYTGPDNDPAVAGAMQTDPVESAKATAHFLLGQILAQQKRLAEAQAHFVAAATAGTDGRSGLYPAALAAALNYALGQGVPRDQAKASEMLDQSRKLTARLGITLVRNYVALKIVDEFAVADLEESIAEAGTGYQNALQFQIALVFADKKSKDYNPKEAVKWYELAAENDQAWAMLSLALLYAGDDLGAPDPVKAFQWLERADAVKKAKHYLAEANLGICYETGFGTPRDPAKAAALFNKYRNEDIICYLGSIGKSPTKLVSYEAELALNDLWAQRENAHAQYLMGVRYLNGWGVKADPAQAVRWLKKAAKNGSGRAYCQIGLLYQNARWLFGNISIPPADKAAWESFQKGALLGDPAAMSNYGTVLQSGRGGTADVKQAESWYLKALAADPDQNQARNNLGAIYENQLLAGTNTVGFFRKDELRAKMLECYETAAKAGYGWAANNLGRIYYEGVVVAVDYAKAYAYLEQAAASGYPLAHYQLGVMHEKGIGIPVTLTEAAYHYRLAALEGHVESLRRLINFYLTGQGVSVDLDRAQFWLQRMVQLGYTNVLTTMADVLIKKGEYAEAVKLLKKLAESENAAIAGFACDRLSQCYEQGLGVKADPARAKKYFNLAVQKGDSTALTAVALQQIKQGKTSEGLAALNRAAGSSGPACYYLGQMYYFGTNVPQDRAKGIDLMRKSAGMNHPEALYFLAVMTYNNDANAPSLDEAIRFAQQAETTGFSKASEVREKLELRRKTTNPSAEEKTGARSS